MKQLLPLFVVCMVLAGCGSKTIFPRYSDQSVTFTKPVAQQKPVQQQQACDMTGNVTRQSNTACVGRVSAVDRNSPTITVVKPGVAVPAVRIETVALAPPR